MKYYIIPVNEIAFTVDAVDAADAMESFATQMDLDMNVYFKAVTEEEYERIKFQNIGDTSEDDLLNFYVDELEEYDRIPKHMIYQFAKRASQIYCEGNGYTEYEALEKAIEEYEERR